MTRDVRLNLKELRQARELSQQALGQALGVSRQAINALEQGDSLPSLPLLIQMISYFNCPLNELISTNIEPSIMYQLEKGGDSEMQLIRFDPFQAVDRLHGEMSDLVERTFGRVDWPRTLGTTIGALNIHENDKEYVTEIQAPGFKENDITVEATEDSLTISGEVTRNEEEGGQKKSFLRREWEHSQFSRTIRFANRINHDKIEAHLADGLLTVTAPKVEPAKPKTTKIAIKKR